MSSKKPSIKPKKTAKKPAKKKRLAKAAPTPKPTEKDDISVGRPTDYHFKYCEQAKMLCLLGATDEQIAEFFGICVATYYNWRNEHPEFLEAVKSGKKIANAEVAHSLFSRAKGCTVKETTYERVDLRDNLETLPDEHMTIDIFKKKIVIKELPPDQGAAMNWLKNREPDLWRDKQVVQVGLEGLPEDELDARIMTALNALSKTGSK